MRIYTKTGDKGKTGLYGKKRVSKASARVEAYGSVDELNSVLGIARALAPPKEIDAVLETVQQDLFTLGADLATPDKSSDMRILGADVRRLEKHIDDIDPKSRPLRHFILPGGTSVAATLQLARTVCRRAERRVVMLSEKEDIGEQPMVYLNRLADLLFVLARYANQVGGGKEHRWERKK